MKNITYNSILDDSRDMPIAFRTVCTQYDQETLRWQENYTDFYILQFIVGGSGILRCRDREYTLSRGSAFFIRKGVAFEYINTGNLRSAFMSSVGVVPEIFSLSCKSDCVFYPSVDIKKYVGMIGDIEREYYLTSKKAKLSSMAYGLLAEFFSEAAESPSSINEQVLTYIKRNFNKRLTLEDISNNIGISVSKLCHDFKRAHGCSVFTMIKNLRLDYAREMLLSNGNMRVKDIAAYCGFDDLSYFCSAYKKRFNKSPVSDKPKSQ